jgi:hypothetical protein
VKRTQAQENTWVSYQTLISWLACCWKTLKRLIGNTCRKLKVALLNCSHLGTRQELIMFRFHGKSVTEQIFLVIFQSKSNESTLMAGLGNPQNPRRPFKVTR